MLRQSYLPAFALLCIATLAGAALPASGQTKSVRSDVHHDVSRAVRDLPTNGEPRGRREAEELRLIPLPANLKRPEDPDRVLQQPFKTTAETLAPAATLASAAAVAPAVSNNFDGIGEGVFGFSDQAVPPDTNGAVGLTQYVQWVNLSFAVFDKSTGNLIKGPVAGNSLWQGFGGACETSNDGDPIVTYDKLANRWVFSQLVVNKGSGPFLQCVAVSTTSDATGTFNRYAFQYSFFDDYPKMGVWPDAYYVTFNRFSTDGTQFLGGEACAYDRNAMLSGQSATQVCFQLPIGGVLPSDFDGTIPPPPGSPNFMVVFGSNLLDIFKFHVDFATPSNSTFTGPDVGPVAPFSPLCNGKGDCVPQAGTSNKLDSLADRLMYRLAYRNFGNHESLVVNHSVAVGSGGGIRWYEIQNPNGGANAIVAQQSTFAPDSNFRWMGSIAMDHSGNIAVGYSVSGPSMFPSIAIASRASSDPPSTLTAETTIITGGGSQLDTTRWGDYSAMQVDPVDDCTFWYTTEYLKASSPSNWNTRIAKFRIPGCTYIPWWPTIQNLL